ncbi:hypothetical protein Tco_0542193 [Tanacetum coccineum]
MEMIVLYLRKKLKAMDSKVISLNEELQDMCEKYNELRNGNASKNHLNDDTPMCERHEANDIQSEGVGTDTPYLLDGYGVLGKSSLFFFVDQSIVYGVSLMWIWSILQIQAMVAIDAIPLATKPPMIFEYKIVIEGKFGYFQLIRADGSSKRHLSMIKMLHNIDREDLETLWKLVKAKHGNTRPEEDYERVLWGDLKVMFEPDIKSKVWRNLQGYKVTIWKLFDTFGVHL